MSFHICNYPSHLPPHVYAQKGSSKIRLNPVLVTPPSSTLLQTDENDSYPESKRVSSLTRDPRNTLSADSLLSQANTVGIIGGVSVDSTLNFLRKLTEWSSKGGKCSLPFVVCSDPALNKELRLYEKSSFPSLHYKIEYEPLDPKPIVENLRSKRCFLEKSGVKCIVMPCHIAHSWHEEVSKECSVSFLHMGECVAKELEEAGMKPLEAGSPLRIGVLGTNTILSAGFYQDKLQNKGFEVVLPDKATMEHAVIPAVDALNRNDMEGARNLLKIALQVLLVRAVNTVILASDDMCDILPRDDPLLKKCIDPMDALVRSAIRWAQTAEKG